MYQITDNGLKGRTLDEIKEDLIKEIHTKLPDFSADPETPIGQIIAILAKKFFDIQENLSYLWAQTDIFQAEGENLDRLFKLVGITRKVGAPSTVIGDLYGYEGAMFDVGSEFTDPQGNLWILESPVTLTRNPNRENQPVAINVQLNSKENKPLFLTQEDELYPSVARLSPVTFKVLDKSTPGFSVESDLDFKKRYFNSLYTRSTGSQAKLIEELLKLDGVLSVNLNLNSNANEILVYGGNDEDIFKVIIDNTQLDSMFTGTKSKSYKVPITDRVSVNYEPHFSRPEIVPIYIQVIVKTTTNSIKNYVDKQAILNLFDSYSLNIGESVRVNSVISSIGQILAKKAYIQSIKIASNSKENLNANSDKDIIIAPNQIATFSSARVEVLSG